MVDHTPSPAALPQRWPDAEHRRWLGVEGLRLLDFGRAAALPVGFGRLDRQGALPPDSPVETWVTARMTHIYALALLRGVDHTAELVDHGLAALTGELEDHEHGGWFESAGRGPGELGRVRRKTAYAHAFVVLAASSAHLAGRPGAGELLDRALTIVRGRFLGADGVTWESYDAGWEEREDYRGANSAMHLVEALLAAADATGDAQWRRTAAAIAEDSVHRLAPAHGWLIPEHRGSDGQVRLEFNVDRPDDPFRPYGATPGHGFEWARLLVDLEAAQLAAGEQPTPWLREDAEHLFEVADRVGEAGSSGFVYTVDWSGQPVVRARFHWVLAEAIAAAAVLHRRTGERHYAERYAAWWAIAQQHYIDRDGGSWWHELDEQGRPAESVWPDKPDIYHAYQATVIPVLPPCGSLAGALSATAAP